MKLTPKVVLIAVVVVAVAGVGVYKLKSSHPPIKKETAAVVNALPPSLPSTPVPGVTAVAYGVYNLNGTEIMGDNVNQVWPLASVTKLMTAEIALKNMATDTPITISSSTLSVGGNDAHLQVGEVYPLSTALRIMLVMSDNITAQAIADNYGYPQFIAAMNAEAKSLGMASTTYADPVGLSNLDVSTIADMARLVSYLWSSNQQIFNISTYTHGYVHPENRATSHYIINIDQLAGHPDFMGGKTGTTPDAKDNIVAILQRSNANQGYPFIILVFGSTDRYADVNKIIAAMPQ
jgi:D-alanyl-D-alanine carboxypeptidase